MTVYETGIDDDGNEYRAVWREDIPHTDAHCQEFSELEKETWPSLWSL